nr:hypothetical protein [Pantoea sp. 201603H]
MKDINKGDKYSRRKILGKIIASTAAMSTISVMAKTNEKPVNSANKLDAVLNTNTAPGIILDHATTSWAKISSNIKDKSHELKDNFPALQQLAEEKKYLTIDTPVSISQTIKLNIKNQLVEGRSNCFITPLAGMQSNFLFELHADCTRLHGLVLDNPLLLKTPRGGRQGGIMIAANYCEISNSYFYRMLQSVIASASFGAYGTKILNNWFLECLGAGPGKNDLKSSLGEDRGDAVSIWGSGTILSGNHAYLKEGEDARIAFHAEGLPHSPKIKKDFDHKDIIFMNNMAHGAFRRHFAFENITNGISIGNISMGGATWWGESYTQCKNVIAENSIRFNVPPDNENGAAWHPVKAGVAVLNYNHAVRISSNVLLERNTRASGFAIASQIGDHDITLSGNYINEGSEKNIAIYLNKPSTIRLQNIHTKGFSRAVSILASEKSDIVSTNCIHECNGLDVGVKVAGGVTARLKIDGDIYSGVTEGFNIADIKNISITNTMVEAKEKFASLGNVKENLLVSNNIAKSDKKLSLICEGNPTPDIAWVVDNNTGIYSQLHYSLEQVNNINSVLNQYSKYAGKNIPLGNNKILIALGDDVDSPWLDISSQKVFNPS